MNIIQIYSGESIVMILHGNIIGADFYKSDFLTCLYLILEIQLS